MRNVENYLRAAIEAGWRVRQGSKHMVVYPPSGNRPIAISLRNNEKYHGDKNLRAKLRREGLDV